MSKYVRVDDVMNFINTPNRGYCDYFIIDQIEELCKSNKVYDLEKVVAELEYEKERHETDRSYWAEHEWKDRVVYNECDMSGRKADCYIEAIEIVKGGAT